MTSHGRGEPAHAAAGRQVENTLAYMGGAVLTLAVLAYTLRDMGVYFGECYVDAPSPPWTALGVGILMVFPKTYGKMNAGGVLTVAAKRIGGGTSTVLQALRRKSGNDEPPTA